MYTWNTSKGRLPRGVLIRCSNNLYLLLPVRWSSSSTLSSPWMFESAEVRALTQQAKGQLSASSRPSVTVCRLSFWGVSCTAGFSRFFFLTDSACWVELVLSLSVREKLCLVVSGCNRHDLDFFLFFWTKLLTLDAAALLIIIAGTLWSTWDIKTTLPISWVWCRFLSRSYWMITDDSQPEHR